MRDIRFAFRTLSRAPYFTIIAILTLALGIGATTAIFTVVDGVLLRPLPYPEPQRIVRLFEEGAKGGRSSFSDPNFEDIQEQTRSFTSLAKVASYGMISVVGAASPVRAQAAAVSREFFRTMGVQPLHGRFFVSDEQREGGTPAVVVSTGFWRSALGGEPIGSGRTLTFDGKIFTVVGVAPPELDYPAGAELWVPAELFGRYPSRTAHNWPAVGRLANNVTLAMANADADNVARRLKQQYGDQTDMVGVAMVPLRDHLVGKSKPALLILLGASAVLLLIACANVVNLMMARMAAREGEYALRLALGASRGRLVQQFVAESLVLATGGGILGVVLAAVGVRALLAMQSDNLPRAADVHVSWTVLAFALAVSIAAALAMGLLTAFRAGRGDLRATLAESQRTQAGAGATLRLRGALVVGQVAATIVLLVGAGLLGRSFIKLLQVNPGFRTESSLVLDLSLPSGDHSDSWAARTAGFYDELIGRLKAIPGVREVGGVTVLPLSGENAGSGTFLIMNGLDEQIDDMESFSRLARDPSRSGYAEFRVASGDYFRAMNIPLVKGRLFDERDTRESPHVAVISESLAKERWPNEDPLGKLIQFGNMDGDLHLFTIVGVVGDVREKGLDSEPAPTFYAFYRQRPWVANDFSLVMQGNVENTAVVAAARRAVRDLRPDVPPRFRTIETVVSTSVADRRFTLLLIGVFGASALLLAMLGVYGVISYLVTERRQEIGVRIALGAQASDVMKLVLRQGALLAGTGIVVGGAAALALTRLIRGMLFGVSTTDPLAFVAVILCMLTVALLASFIPARRAAGIAPMSILRGG
ncbi:MAG TPA: ABC transporter permease [Gemmatimonadaceae bacterium]|nr:ABC transporter permease [Gemmatimonadaceae bacterium]